MEEPQKYAKKNMPFQERLFLARFRDRLRYLEGYGGVKTPVRTMNSRMGT
jgi:hypothetical protein